MKIKRVEEINEDYSNDLYAAEEDKSVIYNKKTNQDICSYYNEEDKNMLLDLLNGKKSKKHGNVREVLPQMVQISNNSRITQQTAQRIVDYFESNELMDFKRWLQLIHR